MKPEHQQHILDTFKAFADVPGFAKAATLAEITANAGNLSLLLELIEDRQSRGSLIVTSQLPIKLWHGQFADSTLADATLDRLVHNAEKIELKGEYMRKTSAKTG